MALITVINYVFKITSVKPILFDLCKENEIGKFYTKHPVSSVRLASSSLETGEFKLTVDIPSNACIVLQSRFGG